MSEPDPMDVLRALAAEERAGLGEPPSAHAAVRAAERAVARRRRRRRAGALVGAGSLLLAGGGVAWALSHRTHAPDPTLISCHQTADRESDQKGIAANGTDPAELCRGAWRDISPDWGAPPPLVACVSDTGITHVFPGDAATCASLGMAVLESAYTADELEVFRVRDDLIAHMQDAGCVAPDDAHALAEAELAASSLRGWRVTSIGTFSDAMPCSALAFDPAAKTIAIAPLPDTFGDDQGG